ncbi:MAG: S-adenosylmethionine:tRNA ribosyltransferase-isomerase [Bacteroidota bacterium]
MNLKLDDFLYDLPKDRIAKHPPQHRSQSKLLFYDKGKISHHQFPAIEALLPENSTLVFNNTRVIPARIILWKDTGAQIEIFLLEPLAPSKVHEEVMNATKTCTWKCMIGNAKKWKQQTALSHSQLGFEAVRLGNDLVQFNWERDLTFSDILTEIGKIPLPPYLHREVEAQDIERYQTVYSEMKGAVAAPTAGLHFTNEIIENIQKKGIQTEYLTLHVSSGTFQPIKEDDVTKHPMHNEKVWVNKETIEHLLSNEKTVAVGTTAMRTLESLYWYGVALKNGREDFFIRKEDAYQLKPCAKQEAMDRVLNHMQKHTLSKIGGQTEIYIYPGYDFKMCDGLVTNYHLPGSTLILLIAAFIGADWRSVYNEALARDYRFLSYGDSSLLLR